jgi:hypothetical protein
MSAFDIVAFRNGLRDPALYFIHHSGTLRTSMGVICPDEANP